VFCVTWNSQNGDTSSYIHKNTQNTRYCNERNALPELNAWSYIKGDLAA
jgi:hypothetical protein